MSSRPRPALLREVSRALGCSALLAGLATATSLHAQFGGSGTGTGSGRDRDAGDFGREERIVYTPILIYFPPNPPPLGRAIARTATAVATGGAAPAELAQFVNELFYPALSTRLTSKSLTPKLRAQLDAYRATKLALQAELREALERVRPMDPATRASELATFARRQTPRIDALEASAEQLRRDLIVSDQTWSALRQWRLGDNDRRGFSPVELAQVMRSYAFYENGPSPAQRRLLREISIELAMAGDNTATATAQQPYLFFPPEPARVLLPDDLPAPVAAKLAAYQTKKSTLKKELYEVVVQHDGRKLGFLRGNSLKSLADKQAAALAELETLAEDIRLGLTHVAEPTALAERSPLPPLLQNRVATLMADYAAAQKDATARLEAILAENKGLPMQASYRFDGEGLKVLVFTSRGGRGRGAGRGGSGEPATPEMLARIAEVRAAMSAVAEDYGRRVAALINEKDALRTEIGAALGNAKATAVDGALVAAMRVATANETAGQYGEYRVAVFQPGLSPGQRRVLFDGVMERLELPLPRGERQPVLRGDSW